MYSLISGDGWFCRVLLCANEHKFAALFAQLMFVKLNGLCKHKFKSVDLVDASMMDDNYFRKPSWFQITNFRLLNNIIFSLDINVKYSLV